MRPLRNPVVVGVLVLAAVVLVSYRTVGARTFRTISKSIVPSVASPTAAVPTSAAATPSRAPIAAPSPLVTYTNLEAALLPLERVHATLVAPQLNAWVSAPLRDPFLLLNPGLRSSDTNSPLSNWTLSAIYNQTEGRFAVINRKVYRVGEVVAEGYKLIRIEKDEVWVQGPSRPERLRFPDPKKAPLPGQTIAARH